MALLVVENLNTGYTEYVRTAVEYNRSKFFKRDTINTVSSVTYNISTNKKLTVVAKLTNNVSKEFASLDYHVVYKDNKKGQVTCGNFISSGAIVVTKDAVLILYFDSPRHGFDVYVVDKHGWTKEQFNSKSCFDPDEHFSSVMSRKLCSIPIDSFDYTSLDTSNNTTSRYRLHIFDKSDMLPSSIDGMVTCFDEVVGVLPKEGYAFEIPILPIPTSLVNANMIARMLSRNNKISSKGGTFSSRVSALGLHVLSTAAKARLSELKDCLGNNSTLSEFFVSNELKKYKVVRSSTGSYIGPTLSFTKEVNYHITSPIDSGLGAFYESLSNLILSGMFKGEYETDKFAVDDSVLNTFIKRLIDEYELANNALLLQVYETHVPYINILFQTVADKVQLEYKTKVQTAFAPYKIDVPQEMLANWIDFDPINESYNSQTESEVLTLVESFIDFKGKTDLCSDKYIDNVENSLITAVKGLYDSKSIKDISTAIYSFINSELVLTPIKDRQVKIARDCDLVSIDKFQCIPGNKKYSNIEAFLKPYTDVSDVVEIYMSVCPVSKLIVGEDCKLNGQDQVAQIENDIILGLANVIVGDREEGKKEGGNETLAGWSAPVWKSSSIAVKTTGLKVPFGDTCFQISGTVDVMFRVEVPKPKIIIDPYAYLGRYKKDSSLRTLFSTNQLNIVKNILKQFLAEIKEYNLKENVAKLDPDAPFILRLGSEYRPLTMNPMLIGSGLTKLTELITKLEENTGLQDAILKCEDYNDTFLPYLKYLQGINNRVKGIPAGNGVLVDLLTAYFTADKYSEVSFFLNGVI